MGWVSAAIPLLLFHIVLQPCSRQRQENTELHHVLHISIHPFWPSKWKKRWCGRSLRKILPFQEIYCFFIDLIWEWNVHLYNCVYNLQCMISSSSEKNIICLWQMHKNTWPVFFFLRQYFKYVLLQEEKKKKTTLLWVTNLSCSCRIIKIISPKPKILLLRS